MGLKRIGRRDVRLGMFIERIDGSWLDHPFWRSSFLLTDHADLDKLVTSDIETVVIDESKGAPFLEPSLSPPPLLASSSKASIIQSPPIAGAHRRAVHTAGIEASIQQCRRAVSQIFAEMRQGRPVSPDAASRVLAEITRALDDNPDAVFNLTRLKSVDGYSYLHSIAVSALMVGFSRHLDLDDGTVQLMGLAGLMHDIGKVTISPALLTKPGALSNGEIAIIRTHSAAGHRILQDNGFPDLVLDVALHHHEKLDGSGYPLGLGAQISSYSRIAAICDVYDAMTTLRPYKRAWTPHEALSEMARWTGHFDPACFSRFVGWLGHGTDAAADLPPLTIRFAENGYSDPASDAFAPTRQSIRSGV